MTFKRAPRRQAHVIVYALDDTKRSAELQLRLDAAKQLDATDGDCTAEDATVRNEL